MADIDFEQYIEKCLREIEDIDEKRFARTVLLDGLGKIIKRMENKYRSLEKRIYEEIEVDTGRYETVTTIIRKTDYDSLNDTLFPVSPEDLEDSCLWEQLSTESEAYAGTIFVRADEKTVEQFGRMESFQGTYAGDGIQQAVFYVRPVQRYRGRLELLYRTFQDNHIPWQTVHTGFLDKFYDVFMQRSGEDGKTLKPEEVQVDYGEFNPFVQQGVMPLWNIEQISFDSASFMLPCMDGIYYEHEFITGDADSGEDGYLIMPSGDILEIRHEAGKIIMKSQEETFEKWQAFRIVQKETERSLNYTEPLLSNHKKDSYFRKISEKTGIRLQTKADLFRRIMELDIGEYIEIAGYKICSNTRDYPAVEGMNWFVEDELFPMESRRGLILEFKEKRPGFYLNDSMVRFAVSHIQLEISEYVCVGTIVSSEAG